MKFTSIKPSELKGNPFDMIGKQWMLLTCGNEDNFNTMTANWGAVGVLWHKPVLHCYIRPSRYTYDFMENSDYFTASFYPEKYREQLNICGTQSGRDLDKVRATGFTPATADCGAVYFEEAEVVFVCKKIYYQDIDKDHFLASYIGNNYKNEDYHRLYTAEIVEVLVR